MPQRSAFKTDSSFFRMLAVGAVGAQAVQQRLDGLGHQVVELERGSLATRIWRDVKRKRVRVPDLMCTRCGARIESRAKTRPDLSMSHSPSDAERAWNYGMLDSDWIAFPILSEQEEQWGKGGLRAGRSLWRERTLTVWGVVGHINSFEVRAFRGVAPKQSRPKGVSEGSEVQVRWTGKFAKGNGRVLRSSERRLDYRLEGASGGRHFRLGDDERAFVGPGERFDLHQVVAGQVTPLRDLACPGGCNAERLAQMIRSRERTVRFAGAKLARIAEEVGLADDIRELAADPEEDPYVQMEARSSLCAVAGESAEEHFGRSLLDEPDEQMSLEAAVALAETRTTSAFGLLRAVLQDREQPLFLRSACAWAIGQHATPVAAECLVQAFGDVAPEIRAEALAAVAELGSIGIAPLVESLSRDSQDVAAGAAEALRRIADVPVERIVELARDSRSTWPTWALAHLPREAVAPHIAGLQDKRPDVHFATSVLWTFLESWIAEDWTPTPTP